MKIESIILFLPAKKNNYIQNNYTAQVAIIDEEYCIGCTKCLLECPADAIIGSKRVLHTVIAEYCTGCNKCINICPTTCISMIKTASSISYQNILERYKQHDQRIKSHSIKSTGFHQIKQPTTKEMDRKTVIAEAIARAKLKRQQLQSKTE